MAGRVPDRRVLGTMATPDRLTTIRAIRVGARQFFELEAAGQVRALDYSSLILTLRLDLGVELADLIEVHP